MQYTRYDFFQKIINIPILIPIIIYALCLLGTVVLYSASGGSIHPWSIKQIVTILMCAPITIIITMIDLRFIYRFAYLPYVATLTLLVMVNFMGKSAMGATRWIDFGILSVQPSELMKVSLILMLAKYLHDTHNEPTSNAKISLIIFACIIPIALILKQPDLGTAIVICGVIVVMLFAAGIKLSYFGIVLSLGIAATPLLWSLLHEYQKNRLLTFIRPENDPLGSGYNIIQSKIAIGSGGLFGRGLLNGTQTQLKFLPEYQTDFIFSFLAEELGFLGGLMLIILYGCLITYCLFIAMRCRSVFARLLVIGIVTLFFNHIFINIAMTMGLLPVVGIPLPFISYGRTMMVTMFINFGFVLNVFVNKYNNI